MKEFYVWLLGVVIFAVSRIFIGFGSFDELLIAVLFFILSMHWFLIPFVLRRDFSPPRFRTIVLKRGKDDILRIVFFVLGLLLFKFSTGLCCAR